jgi:hypothetical protein
MGCVIARQLGLLTVYAITAGRGCYTYGSQQPREERAIVF